MTDIITRMESTCHASAMCEPHQLYLKRKLSAFPLPCLAMDVLPTIWSQSPIQLSPQNICDIHPEEWLEAWTTGCATIDTCCIPNSANPSNPCCDDPQASMQINNRARYSTLHELGRGTDGKVYKCRDVMNGTFVAIKEYSRNCRAQPEVMEMSRHSNIVEHFLLLNGGQAVLMEFIEGPSLHQVVVSTGPLQPRVVATILRQVLEGIRHLHSLAQTHSDVKPSNFILEAKTGIVKLCDLGVCHYPEEHRRNIVTAPSGSPRYMAPEQVRGNTSLACDIWGIGCSAVELLSGKSPWDAEDSSFSAMYRIAHGEHTPYPAGISADAVDFLECCFTVLPTKRPTAGELLTHPFLSEASIVPNSELADLVTRYDLFTRSQGT